MWLNIFVGLAVLVILIGVASLMVAGVFSLFGAPVLMCQGVAFGTAIGCVIAAAIAAYNAA